MRDRTPRQVRTLMLGLACLLGLFASLPGKVAAALPDTPIVTVAPFEILNGTTRLEGFDRDDLRAELLDVLLSDRRLQLVDDAAMREAVAQMGRTVKPGCYERECLVELGRRTGADLVVGLRIGGTPRAATIDFELRIVEVAEDQVTDQVRGRGEDPYEVPQGKILDAAHYLLDRLLNPRGTLIVDTIPPESTVLLNGEAIGFAPLTLTRPAGMPDTLRAVRQGYLDRHVVVELDPGEEREVLLQMTLETVSLQREFPHVHAFAIGGRPLDQASSNLDSRLSWGDGESFGARVDAGDIWRIGIGFLTFGSTLDDVDDEVLAEAGVIKDPRSVASLIHSNLLYFPNGETISPYIGVGVGALQRELRHHFDGVTEDRQTDFEAAWMFVLGLEGRVFGPLRLMVELTHVRALIDSDAWKLDDDTDTERALWERSFQDFRSFTIVRAGVGITF